MWFLARSSLWSSPRSPSFANLRTFPFIREREKEGLLRLHGLHFDLASGQLVVLDEASGRFETIEAA
jgi:carbonic anhydrase